MIDDIGRQRVDITELLSRWTIPLAKSIDFMAPLAKSIDFMTLNSGRQIEMLFEQLLVFVTNIVPRDIVDEALLCRIPYKIRVGDPIDLV
ncbi:MAG: hypothetical protein VB878_20270 [Pirellulaceae bacterium]